MPHETTTTDSGDILISAVGDAALITIQDRFSALYAYVDVSANDITIDRISVSASADFASVSADSLWAVSAHTQFLTASALTVHVIDYSIHTTAKASAGNASAVPATAAGYIPIIVSGVSYRLVLYNPSSP